MVVILDFSTLSNAMYQCTNFDTLSLVSTSYMSINGYIRCCIKC